MGQDADHRTSPRRRVFKDGVIQADGLGMACTVRNISERGVLLTASTKKAIEQLTLVIVFENLIKKCRVVWRDGNKMGVAFV